MKADDFLQHKIDRGQPRYIGEAQEHDLDIGNAIAVDIPHDDDFGARALYPQLTLGGASHRDQPEREEDVEEAEA